MATVVARTRIKRDFKKFVYYVKDGAIMQAPRRGSKGQKKVVARWGKPSDMDYSRYIYFVDKDGNVAAATRKGSKGGRKRASTGRKRASAGRKRASAGAHKRRSSGERKRRSSCGC